MPDPMGATGSVDAPADSARQTPKINAAANNTGPAGIRNSLNPTATASAAPNISSAGQADGSGGSNHNPSPAPAINAVRMPSGISRMARSEAHSYGINPGEQRPAETAMIPDLNGCPR